MKKSFRRYETVLLLNPDTSEDVKKDIFNRLEKIIENYNGFIINVDKWGNRKLAYEIKKRAIAYYAIIDFCSTTQAIFELERIFKIDDNYLRFMTVVTEQNANVEELKKLKEEILNQKENVATSQENKKEDEQDSKPVENEKDSKPVESEKDSKPVENEKDSKPVESEKDSKPVENEKDSNSVKNDEKTEN